MTRRTLIAVLAAVAMLLAAMTAAFAMTTGRDRADTPGYGAQMMQAPPSARGWWHHGPRGWMHGAAVGSEFAYLSEMVAHHEEAVTAAEQLQRSDRPQLRGFAASIITTQSAQIDQMSKWLADWYPARSTETSYDPMMRDLSGLSGDRLDRAFLRDMIRHHMAAVMMSQQLLARDLAEHPQVDVLARSIRDAQRAEIFQMSRWLTRWYSVGW